MLIGDDFNQKCRLLLTRLATLSDNSPDNLVNVEKLNMPFGYDRNEVKSYLEYLKERGFINLRSIGGPLLYGHVSVTKKGLSKAKELSMRKK